MRRSGQICVAYYEALGVSCFAVQDGELHAPQHFDESTGMRSNRVYFLGEDVAGRWWVGTGAGLDLFAPGAGATHLEHFGQSEGLPGDDCDARAPWAFHGHAPSSPLA